MNMTGEQRYAQRLEAQRIFDDKTAALAKSVQTDKMLRENFSSDDRVVQRRIGRQAKQVAADTYATRRMAEAAAAQEREALPFRISLESANRAVGLIALGLPLALDLGLDPLDRVLLIIICLVALLPSRALLLLAVRLGDVLHRPFQRRRQPVLLAEVPQPAARPAGAARRVARPRSEK